MSIAELPPQRFAIPITGHASLPGTGPAGQSCGTCAHLVRVSGNRRDHAKCGHRAGKNTRSATTDIRLSHPACRCWSAPA
ncbi:hypothetical protein ACQW02_19815 [Humitalea sp. 24SJ18S-53]|uniref:hypothetical protein n=1 Tax=Humitalea sp. 24SJ18S-53 TaxID=3422307 RepID=UPI003D674E9F